MARSYLGELRVIWEHDLHQHASLHAVVLPSLIVTPERHTKLARLSPESGESVWIADVDNPWGWVAAGGGACAYLNQHSLLQCFGSELGEERWSVELAGQHGATFGHLAIIDGRVLTGGWRGHTDVVARDVATGELQWSLPSRRRALATPVDLGSGRVLLPHPEEGFAAVVRASDGWLEKTLECPRPATSFDATPFIIRTDDQLYCLDTEARVRTRSIDGDDDWRVLAHHKRPIGSVAPTVAGSFLAFVGSAGRLSVYSRAAGVHLWDADVQHNRRHRVPAAALPNDRLAFGSSGGHLFVFNRDGFVLARRHFGKAFEDLISTPDGVLIGSTGGRLVSVALDE